MKPSIYATSDLHGMLPDPDGVPACDIFIIAGDLTPVHNHNPAFQESWLHTHFAQWLGALRARHKIIIAGNHDFVAQERPEVMESHLWTYLQDRQVEVEGLRIYGTPWTPIFYNWAFMRSEPDLETLYAEIPQGIDILISHGPPQGYCDRNVYGDHCGSLALTQRIKDVTPRSVVCGHIHEGHGLRTLKDVAIYNVSLVNFNYRPVNPIVKIELP